MRMCIVALVLFLSACSTDELQVHSASNLDWQSLRGDWVYINYWAEWCLPCREEIPELNDVNKQLHSRVLGVNFDGAQGVDLARQMDAFGIDFPVLAQDPAQRLKYDRPQVLPTTLVFDPQGNLHGVLLGPQTEATLLSFQQ